ncbi:MULTISPECIES: TonB-dependent receptor [unclassified Sphingomonas]|uniref:TonB-dependent receptor n=1 Tax=unclassified Sphingomonas TaxID=196159 RepID=UPI0009EB94A8|nr:MULTISPECIES: TonB-dependent receptor [unclassified Sphingomonas]
MRAYSTKLKLSAALIALAVPMSAGAQEAANAGAATEATDEDIVVTGIRNSLGRAADLKRNTDQFVDAIVADDIGKLPDRNVAESLARVSGVQVDRGIGEGTSVSIRGLRQNVYLFNGRQIYDAFGRGGTGAESLGTSTYSLLAQVPSELISELSVTKLAGADQLSGGLGGIVDIRTRTPLDTPAQYVAKITGIYSEQADRAGYELFGLASQRFADDTLGILVSASYNRRPVSQLGLDTFSGYGRFTDGTGGTRFGNTDARPEAINETRRSLGLNGVIQWRPSPDVEIIADTFYSNLDASRERLWLSFSPTAGLSNPTFSPDDILLSGRATTNVLTNTEFLNTDADVWSSALRGRLRASDRLTTTGEVSYSRSTYSGKQIYFRLQPVAGLTPIVDFDFTRGSFGSYDISGIDLTDPAQLRFTILFDNTAIARTEEFAVRNDWNYDLGDGFLRSIDVGARYSRLKFVTDPKRIDIRPAGGIPATQLADFTQLYSNPDLGGLFPGLPTRFLSANGAVDGCGAFTAFPAITGNSQCVDPRSSLAAIGSFSRINERFVEAYGKLDYGINIGSAILSGNVGVRYVNRELRSTGNLIAGNGMATPITFPRSDNEWLPSFVAKLDLNNGLILRAGAAQVVSYPNTTSLSNGVSLNNAATFDAQGRQITPGGGNGGSPNLEPFKADQYDVSLEYYFGQRAVASVGYFYKDVSTFIIAGQTPEVYDGVNYLISRGINGSGAKVQGVEALLQLPFYFLPSPFDGFGVLATYAYIDTETPIRDSVGRTLPFPGLSRNNVNIVAYYEKDGISIRGAYNWRDQYLIGLSGASTGIYNNPYSDLSATLRYDLSKQLTFGLEVNNILDEQQRTYDGVEEALRTNVTFGRIYKASVALKF